MASPPPQQPQVLPPADGSQPGDIWQQPPLGTYIVTATYTPTLSDEIDIQAGDQVQVFEEYDDGWCLGLNLTRGQTRGVFPKHCVLPDSQNTSSNNLLPDDIQAKAGKRVSSLIMDKTQLL
ncbi:hypothetical protein DM01DRAFT_255755 [Hesseltinella vesiculosa]|uniref:SH3 domain-containing protein n=1 Tax=Hesseltinella vesiculosa TaxID=101127 RepID=A0A1X2GF73_9FUNG|nr:hypothetical protein DM01DRAFT_255755 [Hesseltinella vesiculosa]